jgi:hypothetical protein
MIGGEVMRDGSRMLELVELGLIEPDRKRLDRPRRDLRHQPDDR